MIASDNKSDIRCLLDLLSGVITRYQEKTAKVLSGFMSGNSSGNTINRLILEFVTFYN